ncbi:MAG: hypothetical protein JWM16_2720 [Verrucomicrobiales bacterium]|nr:hypothetical protein [Verrucomicrobiales bacterium]
MAFSVNNGLAAREGAGELGQVAGYRGFNKDQPEILEPDGAEVYSGTAFGVVEAGGLEKNGYGGVLPGDLGDL